MGICCCKRGLDTRWRHSIALAAPLTLSTPTSSLSISKTIPIQSIEKVSTFAVAHGDGYLLFEHKDHLVWFSMASIAQKFEYNGYPFEWSNCSDDKQLWALTIFQKDDTDCRLTASMQGIYNQLVIETVDKWIDAKQLIDIRPFLLRSLVCQWPDITIQMDIFYHNISPWIDAIRASRMIMWCNMQRQDQWSSSDTMNIGQYSPLSDIKDSNNMFLDKLAHNFPIPFQHSICISNLNDFKTKERQHPDYRFNRVVTITNLQNDLVSKPEVRLALSSYHEWEQFVTNRKNVSITDLIRFTIGNMSPCKMVIHNSSCPEEVWAFLDLVRKEPFLHISNLQLSISSSPTMDSCFYHLLMSVCTLSKLSKISFAQGIIRYFPHDQVRLLTSSEDGNALFEWVYNTELF